MYEHATPSHLYYYCLYCSYIFISKEKKQPGLFPFQILYCICFDLISSGKWFEVETFVVPKQTKLPRNITKVFNNTICFIFFLSSGSVFLRKTFILSINCIKMRKYGYVTFITWKTGWGKNYKIVKRPCSLWLGLNYYTQKIWHPGQLKKLKSCGPFLELSAKQHCQFGPFFM